METKYSKKELEEFLKNETDTALKLVNNVSTDNNSQTIENKSNKRTKKNNVKDKNVYVYVHVKGLYNHKTYGDYPVGEQIADTALLKLANNASTDSNGQIMVTIVK